MLSVNDDQHPPRSTLYAHVVRGCNQANIKSHGVSIERRCNQANIKSHGVSVERGCNQANIKSHGVSIEAFNDYFIEMKFLSC